MSEPMEDFKNHVMYVPIIELNGKRVKFDGYKAMDECVKNHGSGMLVAQSQVFDTLHDLKLKLEEAEANIILEKLHIHLGDKNGK